MHDNQTSTQASGPLPAIPATQPKQSLGVGALISDTFAVFFSHIVMICLIGLVPMIVGQVLPGLLLGLLADSSDPLGTGQVISSLVMGLLLLCVYTFSTALVIQLTYDEQLGRRVRVRAYLRPAVRSVPAILALSIAISLILFVAQMLLFLLSAASPYLMLVGVPFQIGFVLWVLAAFSVCAPAVLFEQAGLRGLGRSFELTRDYRWPIAGTLALTCVLIALFYVILGAVIMVFTMASGGLLGALLFGLLSTAGTSILVIAVTLIYARLREIKEGISIDQIAAVFD
ncbi:hypothetical protein [Roseibium sediminicola]|uniref:Glycerophosphoryl diester phosphodiesterase membrane domain-containing protein n=1 Tax=Roseibium sediminicola TaxID=2933272 RepID=A0ABT0GSA3_9HYPH|nr:hypothetical protein [Roseibium sp. CAU 1639]MCK7612318.1 hypothetical protein [Roseibium sp. CAU 1639]